MRGRDDGIKNPPRLLFWGMIGCPLLIVLGFFGLVFGFREILQPAQQQRVIDQLPFMRMFKQPTPAGGKFPTLEPRIDAGDAMSLLDMPLDFASPTLPATATIAPTATATPSQTAAPKATSAPAVTHATIAPTAAELNGSIPPAARIHGLRHQQQKWNNCGPATITMALSYYGWQRDQIYARDWLRPNREDKNVSPHEMVAFVEAESDLLAIARMGGTLDILKRLVANGFPVVIETGAMFEGEDWLGHYRALVAYDDAFQMFYFFDSFLGVGDGAQGVAIGYDLVDRDWQAFNRSFIVIYEPQREALLRSLLPDHWDAEIAAQLAFRQAQDDARSDPNNAFAWFNMGTSLVALERYQEAANAFDQSRRLGPPWRIMWYQFGAFEAYFKLGRYDDVLSLARANLNNARELEETHYWRGKVYQAQGKTTQAAAAFGQALAYNPRFAAARAALDSV